MKKGSHRATFAWAVLLLAGAAPAADHLPAAAKPDAPSGAEVGANPLSVTLERKLRLVKLQLAQSPAAQRIRQSNNTQAKRKLADAQAHYAKAQAEAHAGRPETALQLLDESLRQIVSASSLVPDVAQQTAQERSRNTDLREAIHTFQTLHKNLSSRMATRKGQAATVAAEIGQIDAMVDKADALVASGNQYEANVVLNAAYKIVVSTLNKMLAAETIVYGLKFDSPTDEFRHELARNRSYEELIPIALVQLNSTRESATLAERYVQQSRDLRAAAQKQASGGDHPAAMKTLQLATNHLQRSLRIAGLVVPQSPESMP
nr:hypothetical protein [Rhodoferax sp.]